MRGLKTMMIAGVTAVSCFVATPAFADYLPGDKVGEQQVPSIDLVVDYLSLAQFAPSRLELRQLSADPVAELVKVATGNYENTLRVRALQSLGLYVDDVRAVETVDGLMTGVKPGDRMFGVTLVTWAAMHGEKVVDALLPYATHESEDVRMAAVIALGRFCGQAGFDALVELQKVESDAEVLERITQIVD